MICLLTIFSKTVNRCLTGGEKVSLDLSVISASLPFLLEGLLVTLGLTIVSILIGIVIGSLAGIARVSKVKILRSVATVYIDFIRGTPLLVQVFLIYFGIPGLTGSPVPSTVAAIVALSINSGAYVAEIVRAGIQSIDKGQEEAAKSLGMSAVQAMRYIIFPQTIRRILPPLGNEFISLLKESSLVSAISIEELLRKGQIVITRNFRPFEIYITVALMYLVMTLLISQLVRWMERRLRIN